MCVCVCITVCLLYFSCVWVHACVGSCVHNCTCMWRPEVDARDHLLCSSTILIGQSRAFWYFNQLAVQDPLSLYLHGLQLQTGHHAYLAIVSGYLNSAPHFVNLPLSHLPSPYIDFDSTTGSSYDQCFIHSCECELETNLWSDWADPVGSRWSLKFHLSNNLEMMLKVLVHRWQFHYWGFILL